MPVDRAKVRIVKEEQGTAGGTTYFIKMPGEREARPVCFRRMKSAENKGMRCSNAAGAGTGHPGQGACKFHGGMADTRLDLIKDGRYAVATRRRLDERIQAYLDGDRNQLLDLTHELAASKAILNDVLEHFPDAQADDFGTWLFRFNSIINSIGALIDRVSKIESRNTLTAAQVLYLRATMIDIFTRYIVDPDARERAVRELASRMGGDVAVEMRASEVYQLPGEL